MWLRLFNLFLCQQSKPSKVWGNCMDKQKALLVPVGTQGQHGQVELRWKRIMSQHLLTFRFSKVSFKSPKS